MDVPFLRLALVAALTLSLLGSISAYAVQPGPISVGRLHAINIQLEGLEGRLAEALETPPNPIEPEAVDNLNGISGEATRMIQLADSFFANPGPSQDEVLAELEAITGNSEDIIALVDSFFANPGPAQDEKSKSFTGMTGAMHNKSAVIANELQDALNLETKA